jgi:WD40 repeat protein
LEPKKIHEVQAHAGGVRALSMSADGKYLLSGGQDETLRLWDTARLTELRCIAGDVGPVEDVGLSPGNKWAASCALRLFRSDMAVQIWDLATGHLRGKLKRTEENLYCLAISPDGRRIAAGSSDKTVRIWPLDQGRVNPLVLQGHTDLICTMTFLPGGESLLTGSHDGTVRLWDSKTGANKGMLHGQVGKILAVAFGGPSKRMAIAGNTLKIRQNNGTFTTLHGHRGIVMCVAFSPDGELLLSGGIDHTVRLWQASDGQVLHAFQGHSDAVHAVAFSPDGQTAFSGSADGTIRKWEIGK